MNVLGFDDGPFPREHRGNVLLVGVVCSGTRVDGVVSGQVRRDGADATRRMIEVVRASQFGEHIRAVMLQGVAVGGFNVVDVHELSASLGVPVLVIMRRLPDLDAIRRALSRVRGSARKWRLIERAGPVEPLVASSRRRSPPTGLRSAQSRLWVQRVGLSQLEARALVDATTLHGNVPEPVRVAHLIAGGITSGHSRGRA